MSQPHAVLGVPYDASESEIRAAYHKAAKKYHPDKQSSNEKEAAISHFVEIQEAYEILRNQFDNFRHTFDKEIDDDNDEKMAPRTRPTRESSMNGNKVRKRRNGSRSSSSTEENKPASSSRNGKKQSVTATPAWRRKDAKSQNRHSIHSPPPSPVGGGIGIGISTTPKSQRSLRSVPKFSPTRTSSTSALKNNSDNKSSIRRSNSSHATAINRQIPPTRHSPGRPQRHSSGPTLSSAAVAAAAFHRRARPSLTSPVPPSTRPPLDTSPIVTRKKVNDPILVSPISAGRPQRHSSGPTLSPAAATAVAGLLRRTRSSLASPVPPTHPPLDASPSVTRKKANGPSPVSPVSSTFSPRRKSSATMRTAHSRPRNVIPELPVASPSPRRPKRASTNKDTSLHASLGNLNYHHHPPPPRPYISTPPLSSMRSSSTSNLSTRRSKNAPPPPQTTLERMSIRMKNKAELKAEKKARKEKLMQ